MFPILLFLHSLIRWLVLISLCTSIFISSRKYWRKSVFSKSDDQLRHWTATIAHIQLMIGMVMYFKSTTVAQFRAVGYHAASGIGEPLFFGLIHITLMILSVVIITLGSALARRQDSDREKFRLMFLFFGTALLLICAAIPWPFSPLAQRPFLSPFKSF